MKVETAAGHLHFATLLVKAGQNTGTCFIMKYTLPNNMIHLFLVTNRHVICGSSAAIIKVPEGDCPDEGRRGSFDFKLDGPTMMRAKGHPNEDIDIAVIPLENKPEFLCRAIPTDLILSEEDITKLDDDEEVMIIGYPAGSYDSGDLKPVVEKGTIATPLAAEYYEGPKFLVSASVNFGNSGSPVFLYSSPDSTPEYEEDEVETVSLIGIIMGVKIGKETETPTSEGPTSHGVLELGIVEKARSIVKTMEYWLRGYGHLPWDEADHGSP